MCLSSGGEQPAKYSYDMYMHNMCGRITQGQNTVAMKWALMFPYCLASLLTWLYFT